MKKEQYEERLLSEIQSLGTMMGINIAFTKFLELTAAALGEKLDPIDAEEHKRQYETAEKELAAEELFKIARMTALLCLAVEDHRDNPIDILGYIYHRLKISDEWNGQFFAPDNVARAMAMMVNIGEHSSKAKDYEIINEPTCGSAPTI